MIVIIILASICLLYLWMIHPQNLKDEKWEGFRHYYYAHRGLRGSQSNIPENSMAAFLKAVENGYGIELDVQLTKDGIPVIFHDGKTGRLLRDEKGAVVNKVLTELTLEELERYHLLASEEKVPLFEDVLKLVDGKVPLIVELKVANSSTDINGLCSKADLLLQKYHGLYCVESFHPACVNWYRKNRPEIIRGQLAERPNAQAKGKMCIATTIMQYLLTNFITRPNFIAYNHQNRHNLSRMLCHCLFKNPAVAWTIRSKEELEDNCKYFDYFVFEHFIPNSKSSSEEQ
mgnify:FL=1